MYSKLGTVIAIALAIFPFAVVIAKIAQTEATVTLIVTAAIATIFFAVIWIASVVTVAPETASGPREPAPPVAWSWDGVNRQPDQGSAPDEDAHS
ncbi:MAG TPA: hypothetical protein VF897_01925 [Roseiflexaceae bacterium]